MKELTREDVQSFLEQFHTNMKQKAHAISI